MTSSKIILTPINFWSERPGTHVFMIWIGCKNLTHSRWCTRHIPGKCWRRTRTKLSIQNRGDWPWERSVLYLLTSELLGCCKLFVIFCPSTLPLRRNSTKLLKVRNGYPHMLKEMQILRDAQTSIETLEYTPNWRIFWRQWCWITGSVVAPISQLISLL